MAIAMIVHGGAWAIPDDQVEAHMAGCRAALAAGWATLAAGGTALAACEAAVRLMEDDPIFDAGTGSVLNSAGEVELDAAVMDGQTLAYGAVANVRHLRNPITAARMVLHGPATTLAGPGAEAFAAALGIPLIDNAELVVEREQQLWEAWRRAGQAMPVAPASGHDTVGAIALDSHGNLVAANSTGGTPFKLPGRLCLHWLGRVDHQPGPGAAWSGTVGTGPGPASGGRGGDSVAGATGGRGQRRLHPALAAGSCGPGLEHAPHGLCLLRRSGRGALGGVAVTG